MSNNNGSTNPFFSPVQSAFVGAGVSPMTHLSVNLDASLRIYKSGTVSKNRVRVEANGVPDNIGINSPPQNATASCYNRMIQNEDGSPCSAADGGKCTFRNKLHLSGSDDKTRTPGKENFVCSEMIQDEELSSPNRFRNNAKVLAPRNILKYVDDNDTNSFDSGYSNSGASTCSSDDLNRFHENFRFQLPYGPAPRKHNGSDCSPKSLSGTFSNSPSSPNIFPQKVFNSFSVESCDISDDGFIDQLPDITTTSGNVIASDENAQLPPDFNSLLSGKIFRPSSVVDTPISSLKSATNDHLTFKRFLPDSITRKQEQQVTTTPVLFKSNNSIAEDFALLDKDGPNLNNNNKRGAEREEDTTPFLKRRKANKLTIGNKLRTFSQPSTAPAVSAGERTLFHYGFNKSTKFQRSFSETEAIKQAVQKASSNPDLIGDLSKSFALPLEKLTKHSDLKNISCDTLAKLIRGDFIDTIKSYTIVDCRYPYEYEGGHIKGAVNIYTKEQVVDEFISKNLKTNDLSATSKDNVKRDVLIFHCEFSSERGPNLSRYLRNADRCKNSHHYPRLDYPEMYLLEGGYSEFFKSYSQLCEPCAYLPMRDPKYVAEMRTFRSRSKSWVSIPDYKSRPSFRTRLAL